MSYHLVARPHIKRPSDLKGAKLGVNRLGSPSEFATRHLLKKIGVDPRDVAILQIGNESERLLALSFTRIHGSMFNAPFSLCDMGIKFADVVSVREVVEELRTRARVGTKDLGEKVVESLKMKSVKRFDEPLRKVRALSGLCMLMLGLLLGVPGPRFVFAQPSRVTLNFAYAAMTPSVLPLWIAAGKGFLAKEGIDARLVFIRGSPVLLSAMASGEVQAGYAAGPSVLSAVARGLDLQILASMNSRLSHDIVARPEIINPEGIKGKIFGVQALGGTVWMSAMLGLEYLGLDPLRDKIRIIAIGDQTVLAQALETRAIDVTVLDKPLSISMEKKGFRILTELAKVNMPFASTGIVFRRSFIAKRPEIAERTLRGILRAMGYLFDQRNKSEVIAIMVKKLGLDPSSAELGYEAALGIIDRKPYPTVEGLSNIQRLLSRFNPDVSKLAVEEAVDMRFVERLDKSGFIDDAYRTGGQMP